MKRGLHMRWLSVSELALSFEVGVVRPWFDMLGQQSPFKCSMMSINYTRFLKQTIAFDTCVPLSLLNPVSPTTATRLQELESRIIRRSN